MILKIFFPLCFERSYARKAYCCEFTMCQSKGIICAHLRQCHGSLPRKKKKKKIFGSFEGAETSYQIGQGAPIFFYQPENLFYMPCNNSIESIGLH